MPVATPPYAAMTDPFSERARATRSISEPLTKAERESLATSAATAAADATRKAGGTQASAARSAEEAVHQAAKVRSRWLRLVPASLITQFPTRLVRRKARRRRRRSPAAHLARRARCRHRTLRTTRPTPMPRTTSETAKLRRRGCVPGLPRRTVACATHHRRCSRADLQDLHHSFGEQQRHGLPTKHTGLQREYGRE